LGIFEIVAHFVPFMTFSIHFISKLISYD
jgi:hypothetical protein